ncbi:MAG: nuclear transport factor 2 family protein [Longimicrobiales bacterium]
MIGAWIARRKLQGALRTLEAHDLDGFTRNLDDDAVFIYPGDIDGVSGAHEGRDAIRRFFSRWLDQFPTVRFTVHNLMLARPFDLAGTNTAALEMTIDVTNRHGDDVTAELVTVIQLRRGRAVRVQDYVFETGDVVRRAWGEPAERPTV